MTIRGDLMFGSLFGLALAICVAVGITAGVSRINETDLVYEAGREAVAKGVPADACPYAQTIAQQDQRERWLKGWIAGKSEKCLTPSGK